MFLITLSAKFHLKWSIFGISVSVRVVVGGFGCLCMVVGGCEWFHSLV
jgi:hypothetical protein